MKIACPHCSQHIEIDDSWFGKLLNCPNCRAVIDIPGKHTHDLASAVKLAQQKRRPLSIKRVYYALTAVLLVLILIPLFWHGFLQTEGDDRSQDAADYLQDRSSKLADRHEAPPARGRTSNAITFYLQDIVHDYRDRFGDVPMYNYRTTIDEMLREISEPDVVKIVDEVVMPRLAELSLARDYDRNKMRLHYRNNAEAPYPFVENLDPQTVDRLSGKALDIAGVEFPVRSARSEEKPISEVASPSTDSATAQAPEPSDRRKSNVFNRVFRTKAGKDASEETAPDPVQKLLASPELWPREVTLAQDTEFPAVLNGKVVGKVKVNAGAKVGLTAIDADAVEVEFRGGKIKLSHKETDLSQLAAALDANPNESRDSSHPSGLDAAVSSHTGMAAPALTSVVGIYQTTNADTTLAINADGTAHYRSLVSVIHYKDAQDARNGLLPKNGTRTTVSRGTWKTNDGKLSFDGSAVVTLSVEGRQTRTNTAPLAASFLLESNGDLVAPRGETSTRLLRQVSASAVKTPSFDASKPIKIGFNLAMSGGDAPLDASSLKAAKLFFDEVNDKGGLRVAGQPLKLEMTVRDNRSDGGQAAAVTRKLVLEDEVVAIVGPNSSHRAIPAAKVAENQKCPLIAPWSTYQSTTLDSVTAEPKEYVFRGCFLDEHQIEALAAFAVNDLKLRKAAILASKGDQQREDSQPWLFKKFFEENGGEVVAFEFLDANEDDSPAYSRIRSLKPDAIFSVHLSKDLLEKMKIWGINAQLLGGDAWTRSRHLLGEHKEQPIVGHYSTHFSAANTDSSTSRFKTNYRKVYGEEPDEVAALTYDACTLLAEAIKRANTVDRDTLRDELKRLKNFRGVTGSFSYSDPPHDPSKSVFIVRVDKDSTRLVKEMRPNPRARINPSRAQTPKRSEASAQPDQTSAPQESPPMPSGQASQSAARANQKKNPIIIPFVPSIDQINYPVTYDILEIGVPEELANPTSFNPKVGRTVPVVIVNMLHAQPDGLHVNNREKVKTGNEALLLYELSHWHLYQNILGKLAVEESSRFRGYANPDAAPYIGIQVVKYFNVYASFPVPEGGVTSWKGADRNRSPDFHRIFERIGLKRLVEEQGVKEVWFSAYASYPESNMASPITGDISNSHRVADDLPVYEKTYIVYSHPPGREVDIFLHCRSHQYEAMLRYMNRDFFHHQFVRGADGAINAGNCHWPPNARKDPSGKSRGGYHHYLYGNRDYVESSIETWIPYTKTKTKKINASYWGSRSSRSLPAHVKLPVVNGEKLRRWKKWQERALAHNSGDALSRVGGGWCVDKNESDGGCFHTAWLVTWAQQFPGEEPIRFKKSPDSSETYETTNWWDIILDWDEHALRKARSSGGDDNHFGLYQRVQDS